MDEVFKAFNNEYVYEKQRILIYRRFYIFNVFRKGIWGVREIKIEIELLNSN